MFPHLKQKKHAQKMKSKYKLKIIQYCKQKIHAYKKYSKKYKKMKKSNKNTLKKIHKQYKPLELKIQP